MLIRTLAASAVASASLCCPATAQSSDPFLDAGAVEARLSLRIPLGPRPGGAQSAPQVDLGFRREVSERITLHSWQGQPTAVRETRLGFTLSDSPTLMLDGRAYRPMTAEEAELLGLPRPVVGALAVAGAAVITLAALYVCCADFSEE